MHEYEVWHGGEKSRRTISMGEKKKKRKKKKKKKKKKTGRKMDGGVAGEEGEDGWRVLPLTGRMGGGADEAGRARVGGDGRDAPDMGRMKQLHMLSQSCTDVVTGKEDIIAETLYKDLRALQSSASPHSSPTNSDDTADPSHRVVKCLHEEQDGNAACSVAQQTILAFCFEGRRPACRRGVDGVDAVDAVRQSTSRNTAEDPRRREGRSADPGEL
jgi:hypothetical protein